MAVKAVLASLEGVAETLAPEYKKGEDGKFYLDVDGIDDHVAVGALKRAKEHEKTARLKAEDQARAAVEANVKLEAEIEERLRGVMPKDNVERLEKSWHDKLTRRETELTTKIAELDGGLKGVLIDKEAARIAGEIAKDAISIPLFLPHIIPRLTVETVDGKPRTRVLDLEGKPSALTLDDLKKEISAAPMFASLILGSKATGGGAEGGHAGGGAPAKKIDLTKATPAEKVAHYKAKQGLAD